ncbi:MULTISPECIES: hypothetical protein [Meridianimarinicoccus]|uniref:hypothetical protein n=1 Tax=Meridianimarinicoccus zhengii TaxID=2056810 RepID=UPI0013A6C569|nr:hypothetical protein [Phycocomes zhengii]
MRVDLRQSEREFSVNYVTLRMVDAVFHPDELGAAMFLSQSAKQTVDAALHAILSEMTAELNAQMGPDALMRRISDRPKD